MRLLLTLALAACCPRGIPNCGKPGTGGDDTAPSSCPGGLVVTEVMPDAPGSGTAFPEWVELFNSGDEDASLVGLQLERVSSSGTTEDTTLTEGVAAAGDHVVLAAAGADTYDFTADATYTSLNLVGGPAELFLRCDGEELDHVEYQETDDGTAWQVDPGSESADANDDVASWCAATTPLGDGFGTPGDDNPTCPVPVTCPDDASLAITEVLPDAAGDDADWEFVEVVNLGAEAVPLECISIIELTDEDLECEGSVGPGEYLLIARNPASYPDVPIVCGVDISLNNAGEDLAILAADSTGVWHDVFHLACGSGDCPFESGVSAQVDPSALGSSDLAEWCPSTSAYGAELATPGAANTPCDTDTDTGGDTGGDGTPSCDEAEVGELILTEVMPDPAAVGDADGEYVEIYNAGTRALDLAGLQEPCIVDESLILAPGEHLVLVKNGDASLNGGIEGVDCPSFDAIVNSGGSVELACATTLDSYSYATVTSGVAQQRGYDGASYGATWCDATAPYGAGDLGSPGSANAACE